MDALATALGTSPAQDEEEEAAAIEAQEVEAPPPPALSDAQALPPCLHSAAHDEAITDEAADTSMPRLSGLSHAWGEQADVMDEPPTPSGPADSSRSAHEPTRKSLAAGAGTTYGELRMLTHDLEAEQRARQRERAQSLEERKSTMAAAVASVSAAYAQRRGERAEETREEARRCEEAMVRMAEVSSAGAAVRSRWHVAGAAVMAASGGAAIRRAMAAR